MTNELTGRPWSRRSFLKAGAGLGAVGLAGLPLAAARAESAAMNFMQFIGPGGPAKTQSDWIVQLVDAWNSAHDEKVSLEYVPDSEYIGGTKLSSSFASGAGPDVFLISPGDFLRYYNGGVLADLSPFIEPAARADFPETVIANRMVDGKIFGVPMEVEPMAFYYSVKAFEDAGLSEKDVPKTWDELLEIGKKLTTSDRYGLLFETAPGYYQNFTWYPFMWQGGGEFQDASGKSTFDSPATVAALKLWQDAVASGAAPRQALGGGGSDIVANLGSGYCAIQNMGIWGISDMANNAPDFKYGVFRLPVPTGGKYVTVGGGWAFVANARGRNPEAAGRFIAWALASMSPDSIQRVVDWCTVAKSDMPPRDSALKAGAAAFDKGELGVFTREIHPGTRAEPRLPPEVYKSISDAIQGAMLGGVDAAEAARTASQQIDGFLATYKGAPLL
jgi:multiple sugar transport system substrate-binding protein